jgi:hypothetical protein
MTSHQYSNTSLTCSLSNRPQHYELNSGIHIAVKILQSSWTLNFVYGKATRETVFRTIGRLIMQHTGNTAEASGIYAGDCGCNTEIALSKGEKFPPCRNCNQEVNWTLRHETKAQKA